MILLIGAGLLIRSIARLHEVKPGFATKDVLTVPIELPRFSYAEAPRQAALYQRALEHVGKLPGVDAVGGIDDLPLTSDRDANRFTIEGLPPFDPGQSPVTQVRTVTPGYFRTMSIPIIKGRPFDGRDTSSALPVLLINESFAQRFFPGEDPIGRRVKFGLLSEPSQWLTIVGIVGDVRDLGLDTNADLEVYVAYEQSPLPFLNLVVRAKGEAKNLAAAVRDEIHALDKDLPLLSVRPMEAVLAASISDRQLDMILLSVFASVALLLAAVGIYGVISYSVSQQTRQIGIRMALGAQPADVLKLVLQSATWQTLVGAAVGLAGALALTQVIKSQLYEVGSADPATIGAVVLLVFTAALFASWLPAHRAARVDPMEALRYE
ncbi:MAG TPA: FtsX-like permease family protein [Verrucomicrobiae bacterium]|nr:FtsX-like permease family protein [Verrucomicrobiae bacterium]